MTVLDQIPAMDAAKKRLESRLNKQRQRIKATEETIAGLLRKKELQERYLRQLGQKLAESQTFQLI